MYFYVIVVWKLVNFLFHGFRRNTWDSLNARPRSRSRDRDRRRRRSRYLSTMLLGENISNLKQFLICLLYLIITTHVFTADT